MQHIEKHFIIIFQYTRYIWFKFYIYNKYIKNLAPCFTRASAILLPHALGDTRPWHHRSPFTFDYLTTYTSYRGSEHGFEIQTGPYGPTEKTANLSFFAVLLTSRFALCKKSRDLCELRLDLTVLRTVNGSHGSLF